MKDSNLCNLWIAKLETLYSSETTFSGLCDPTEDTRRVVAIAEDVITSRQAMLGALDLHLVELFHVKLVIADHTPIVRGRVHRETRRETAVRADN